MCYCRILIIGFAIVGQVVLVHGQRLIADDVAELGKRLVARHGTLVQGTIEYETRVFVTDKTVYDRLRNTITHAQYILPDDDITKLIALIGQSDGTKPTTGFSGNWYYDSTKTDQWRITRVKLPEFSPPADTQQAGPDSPRTEDVAFNGQYVTSVRNNEYVVYRTKATVLDYPQVMELDISLAPWHSMLEMGPNPGQKITASADNDEHKLVFATEQPGPQASSVTHLYSASLGYAPLRTVSEVGGIVKMEIFHAYTLDREGTTIPTPTLTTKADFVGGGKVRLVVWHIKTWKDTVKETDLKPVLPESYVMVDQRFGKSPLFISRDAEGQMITRSLEEMGKTVGQEATAGTSGATNTTSEPDSSLPAKPMVIQEKQTTQRTSSLWLWLGLVGGAMVLTLAAVLRLRCNKTRRVG